MTAPNHLSSRARFLIVGHSAERVAGSDDNGSVEFSDVVRTRHMVRAFRDEPVDPEAVDRIVDAGLSAPSAGNTGAASLVVVTEPARRVAIAEAAGEDEYAARGFDRWLSGAPVHLVLVTSERAYRDRYAEADKGASDALSIPWWWVDAGAALEAVLLAAVDEGLGAGFLGAHAIDGLDRIVGLPEETTAVGVVTIGHPAPDRRSGSLGRDHGIRRHDEEWTP